LRQWLEMPLAFCFSVFIVEAADQRWGRREKLDFGSRSPRIQQRYTVA
jgi:hypothetical protein